MNRLLMLALIAAAGLPAVASAAPIYRCAGAGGATVFSQVPCGKDAAQVGPSGAQVRASAAPADANADKAALAEIDKRCESQRRKILDSYSARFEEANKQIADLHKHVVVTGPDGSERDPAVHKKIEAVEARKTELLGAQDRELSTLSSQCQMEHTAELKRQADRDTARSMVKR
jgi:Domain of unknown function (DUF4124)